MVDAQVSPGYVTIGRAGSTIAEAHPQLLPRVMEWVYNCCVNTTVQSNRDFSSPK